MNLCHQVEKKLQNAFTDSVTGRVPAREVWAIQRTMVHQRWETCFKRSRLSLLTLQAHILSPWNDIQSHFTCVWVAKMRNKEKQVYAERQEQRKQITNSTQIHKNTPAQVGGGHGWSILGGLRCQTQKELKSPQEKEKGRCRSLAWEEGCHCYSSPASKRLLPCLFAPQG